MVRQVLFISAVVVFIYAVVEALGTLRKVVEDGDCLPRCRQQQGVRGIGRQIVERGARRAYGVGWQQALAVHEVARCVWEVAHGEV